MPLILIVIIFCTLTGPIASAQQDGPDHSVITHQQSAASSDPNDANSSAVDVSVAASNSEESTTTPEHGDATNQAAVIVPGQISGAYEPLVTTGATQRNSFAKLGMSVGAFYDDNGYDASPSAGREWQYSFIPSVAVQRSDARSFINLGYGAGVAFDELLPGSPQISQSLSCRGTYDLTRHLHLAASEGYSITDNPFDSVQEVLGDTATLRQPGQLNPFIVTAASREAMEMFSSNLEWQVSPHNTVGISGGRGTLNYDAVAGMQNLGSSDSADVHLYYARQITARQSIGVTLQWQDLGDSLSLTEASTTRGRAIQYTHVINLNKELNVSFYGGPEQFRTTTTTITGTQQVWTFSGGGALAWRRSRFGVRLGYDNGGYDGGGLSQAVRTQSGNADLLLETSKKTKIGVDIAVGDSNTVGAGALPSSHYRSTSVRGFIERVVVRNLLWRADYEYIAQSYSTYLLGQVDHNRMQTELSYSFERPFGAR